MSLVRVQTRWTGVGGTPYYTNLYAVGPLSTNNGNDLATAWRTFLVSYAGAGQLNLIAQIQPELLEFDETTGIVTGAGSTVQAAVPMSGLGDPLPHSNQGLIKWTTAGIVHNRRVRGRTFLPGALESNSTGDGVPSAGHITAINGMITTLLGTMTNRMRVWAQPFEGEEGNPARAGSAHAITAGSMANYWAILRSRRD